MFDLASPVPIPTDAPAAAAPDQRLPAFVNPESPNAAAARAALLEAGSFRIHDLDPPRLRAQLEEAVADGPRRIVVAGGDGTLGTAAAAVLGTATEIAVVPAGTLNHFARDHRIPESLDDAIAAALGSATRVVDAAMVNDQVFLNTASAGIYVRYLRVRERVERRIGYRLASIAALLATFFRPRSLSVELQRDGITRLYRTPLLFVGVGERELKAPKFGGRLEGGARGLHVMIVRGRRPARLLTLALAAIARGVQRVASTPDLDAFVVDSFTVTLGRRRSILLALDGELVRVPTPLRFTIRRDALRIVAATPPADLSPGNDR